MMRSRAFRITLAYTEGSFALQSATHLDKVVGGSASLDALPQAAGSWIAVEDARGRTLYRRVIENPFGAREVFTGEEREFRRVPGAPPSVLLFLIPDLPDAERVVLYVSDPEDAPARLVFTVLVRDVAARATHPGGSHGR